jgi:ParB-like chromosome segregation protein Spo0J
MFQRISKMNISHNGGAHNGSLRVESQPIVVGGPMTIAQRTRPLSQIRVGVRHRKDLGDIDALARSIDNEGLIQPVAITPADELIAGERRMRAWARSKYRDEPIPVHVVDIDEIVRGEWSENSQRKDFTPSEIVALKRALEPKLREEAKERQGMRTDLRGTSPDVEPPAGALPTRSPLSSDSIEKPSARRKLWSKLQKLIRRNTANSSTRWTGRGALTARSSACR